MDDGCGQELVDAVVGRVDDASRQIAPDLTLKLGMVKSFKVAVDIRTGAGTHFTDSMKSAGGG